MKYLRLIRFENLIFIALVQIFIRYGLFQPFGIDVTLSLLEFALLVVATLCIAAAGNIINDIYDVEIDKINKPNKVLIGKSISEKSANGLFILFNVVGVGIGFYLSNLIGRPGFSAIFVAFSGLLYIYASYLKGILVIGNLVISFLVAMSLIIVPLFDLLPAITPQNQASQSYIFKIVLDFAFFAFIINFIREIVKDLQDINGDKKGGTNTLPIAIGRKRTTIIASILGMFLTFYVIFYMYENLYNQQILMLYFLVGIVGPLLYFCIKAWSAENSKDFGILSTILKIVMFTGTGSMLLFQLTISS